MNDIYLIMLSPIILLIFCLPFIILGYIRQPYHDKLNALKSLGLQKINELEKIDTQKEIDTEMLKTVLKAGVNRSICFSKEKQNKRFNELQSFVQDIQNKIDQLKSQEGKYYK